MTGGNRTQNWLTFVFTDIEGSTRMWEDFPDRMGPNIERHDGLLKEAIEREGGQYVKGTGDGILAAFSEPASALQACIAAQHRLASAQWDAIPGIKVRMAIHFGDAEPRDGDYFGPTLNRLARLLAIGHGGQILASETYTAVLHRMPEGVQLRPMGPHRLKDLGTPMTVFQVDSPGRPTEFPPLRSLSLARTNLPTSLLTFLGREQELETVGALVAGHRLVTLVGSGGVGKTRLSLQAGSEALDAQPDGVWVADLTQANDLGGAATAVLDALQEVAEPNESPRDAVLRHLAPRRLLLILDNCEQVVDNAASLARDILAGAPGVRVLAASREPLGVPGEQIYRVPNLQVPSPRAGFGEIASSPAVALFVERARRADATFVLDSESAKSVSAICRRLDGIPLCLELAAARVGTMPLVRIASRLDDAMRLLSAGPRGYLPRQQTLQALIDWSYRLLHPLEQRLLSRLAVFGGTFTLDLAVRALQDLEMDEWAIEDGLASLVQKSLLATDFERGEGAYRLMNTIGAYASHQLRESGEERRMRGNHLRVIAEASGEALAKPQSEMLQRLDDLGENARKALSVALAGDEEALALGLAIAVAYKFHWLARGHYTEARHWLDQIERRKAKPSEALAEAQSLLGSLCLMQGDLAPAHGAYTRALETLEAVGNTERRAGILANLGNLSTEAGDFDQARRWFAEAQASLSTHPDPKVEVALCNNMGRLNHATGRFDEAKAFFERALTMWERVGDRLRVATVLNNLGAVAFDGNDLDGAKARYTEALDVAEDIGERRMTSICLMNLGEVHVRRGEFDSGRAAYVRAGEILLEIEDKPGLANLGEGLALLEEGCGELTRALELIEAAQVLRDQIGVPRPPNQTAALLACAERCRSGVGGDVRIARRRISSLVDLIFGSSSGSQE